MKSALTVRDEPGQRARYEMLARVAAMYYRDNLTQMAIARQLGLSRPKVQRLLQQARAEGIVEIRIHALPLQNLDLEARLKAAFQLTEAIVTAVHPDPQLQREATGRAAAAYLERHLKDGMVVAVGMGRNTGEIPRFFTPYRSIDCTFVSAMGGSPLMDTPVNPNEICRSLAARCGGRAESLYAPAYVENARIRDELLQQEAVRHTLEKATRAHIALVGIGSVDESCTLVRCGCLSVEEIRRLRGEYAVGDILGNYFNLLYGQVVPSGVSKRLIGLSLEDLRCIPTVVAVVSEAKKTLAILGALRSGLVDVLIVDGGNAQTILQLVNMEEENLSPERSI
jgi:DNA-binding transcriptional regulator LsrR (DeoR family)